MYNGAIMRVILTHEQADFDAVASQLGAWLLDRAATPVIPARVNRNVRAFLTLYGAELPFVERDELPPGRVEAAVPVPTQTLITVRGLDPALPNHSTARDPSANDNPLGVAWQVFPTGGVFFLNFRHVLSSANFIVNRLAKARQPRKGLMSAP